MPRFQRMIAINQKTFEYCARLRAHYECKVCGQYLCTSCK